MYIVWANQTGKQRLDLLVATHRHEDHIKGFDPEWFKNIQVRNIWLSKVMDPNHPQAKKVNALHGFAFRAMQGIVASQRLMSPEAELLSALYRVSNEDADELLMKTLPKANQIKPKYVYSGQTGKDLGLDLASAEIRVLGPEQDIDGYYLGEEADASLRGFQGIGGLFGEPAATNSKGTPNNISAADFKLLQSRMLSNGLAFAAKDSSIQNNMSVVLLIEWKKRRLLFVGDAEWNGEFKEGKQNGSWNVMWEKYRKTHLKQPLDFLKIGHHGSINATPPPADQGPHSGAASEASVYGILDTLLPIPKADKKPTALAVVSTEREFYDPIPECKLLVDLARRVSNTRNYGDGLKQKGIQATTIWTSEKAKRKRFFEKYEKAFLDQPQPLRTDLEFVLGGRDFIDIELGPKE